MTDALNPVNTLTAIEQDNDLLVMACLRLDDDLTAGATRCYGLLGQFVIRAAGCNGENLDRVIRVLCAGGKQGCAFSAESGREGSILLVTANILLTIVQYDTGTHMEIRVGGIAAAGSLNGQMDGLLLFGCQLAELAFLYS